LTVGPQLPFSDELHATKYRGQGESFREAINRNAYAMADDDDHYQPLRNILMGQFFLPAGRVQSAMGSTKVVTAHNCFVSGTIEDSFIDGNGSIMSRASEAAATMRMGGGIGYDFSSLRPRGALIKKLESRSSGPISFMGIFDAVCKCVASSGHRRGAQMGVLRIDHPDIEEFVHAKQNSDKLTGFNMSVGVTDRFMECLLSGELFELKWGGEVYKKINASALWETIMRSTWDWAEPGVIFVDTINRMNNLWYCETIVATNPCGEQPLPPYGACLLGSFNLTKYIFGMQGSNTWDFNWEQFRADIPHVVRAMDNVIDRATYPLYEQEAEAKRKRRMGLGVTGLANAVEAMGHSYGSPGFLAIADEIFSELSIGCYLASADLAEEKGSFPLYDRDKYMQSEHIKSLPQSVQDVIYTKGIRNSHLTSCAPTGTISLTADNPSSGIESVFSYNINRTVQEFDGPRVELIPDYGVSHFNVHGKVAADVTVEEHLAVLAVATRHMDSAVSKTCNVPGTTSWEEFKNIYVTAWETGCKGVTTFRTDGKRDGILVVSEDDATKDSESEVVTATKMMMDEEPTEACYIDPVTGRHECE